MGARDSKVERRVVSASFRDWPGGNRDRAWRGRDRLSPGAVAMKIERVTLRQIRMPLVHFFETSFSRTYKRDIILVEVVESGGAAGWGEVTAGENPFYNEE